MKLDQAVLSLQFTPHSLVADVAAVLDTYAVELRQPSGAVLLSQPALYCEMPADLMEAKVQRPPFILPPDGGVELRLVRAPLAAGEEEDAKESKERWPFYVDRTLMMLFRLEQRDSRHVQYWQIFFLPGGHYGERRQPGYVWEQTAC